MGEPIRRQGTSKVLQDLWWLTIAAGELTLAAPAEKIRVGRHAEIETDVYRDGNADKNAMLETGEKEETTPYVKWLDVEARGQNERIFVDW